MDINTVTDALKAVVDKDFSAFKDTISAKLEDRVTEKKGELYDSCRAQLKDRETLYKKD